jgi:hypothetical protein
MAGKYEKSFVGMFDGVDELIRHTDHPLHKRILLNYRRHGLLEVSKRWKELLGPEMTVAEPSYLMNDHRSGFALTGREAVAGFYGTLIEAGAIVLWPFEQVVAVADWGFASEAKFYHFMPGSLLAAQGDKVDDPGAMYLVRRNLAMFWHYTSDAKLIGENVYETAIGREIIKPAPEDVITPERARELLAPLLENPPA